MVDQTPSSRRSVLKTTGVTVGTVTGLSQTAAARRSRGGGAGEQSGCQNCPEVVEETEQYKIVKVEIGDKKYLYRMNKGSMSVSLLDEADAGQSLDTDKRVSAQSHDIIREVIPTTYRMGSCGGYVYNTHRAAIMGVNTGTTLDQIPETALSGALCTLATSWTSWPSLVFGAVCAAGYWLFFDHVNLVGTDFSIGGYDTHVGWLGEEAVQFGIANSVESHHSNLLKTRHVKGAHMGGADDVINLINSVAP